ncbi:TetR/AcrR family transcriptional regulator [Nonomuraea sp. NEAU-A123]|uniref:TetR/AcrR family transcriptional regulator n=1 Tax=Nonomuraea sp. NEAU-A123 TaxID=2839649 RepID=UPI001BE470E0|nr:TetR/AcrR family transcriptional regulator [Nonomuraea sp. NEAU-A123]MBT2231027.1 TetR/AcrR family transcriptional regulator [Nonomuraea sp. NEAU-A123]
MPRDVSTSKEVGELRGDLLEAAVRVLREQGAPHLTLRRVAEEARTSTMGIYTCFGGRAGLLEAVYRYGFDVLREMLLGSLHGHAEPRDRIMAVAYGYREFALADPALYALMFERPLPDFDPSPELRQDALGRTFSLLTEAIGATGSEDPTRMAYLVWTTIHGLVSIELTCSGRSPLPGWFLDSREEGGRVLADGVSALLRGLRQPGEPAGSG